MCKNACLFGYLFICLFGLKGEIWYPILHTDYTKLSFSDFSIIFGISGTPRMGGHPWVTRLLADHS